MADINSEQVAGLLRNPQKMEAGSLVTATPANMSYADSLSVRRG